jgi:L-seryl-tRNA(Ser) seleniumtransferase
VGANATVDVVEMRSTVGGGSLPGETLPSIGLALESGNTGPDRLLAALRAGSPAVIGRIEDGRVLLDLRTVDPGSDATLAKAIAAALEGRRAADRP